MTFKKGQVANPKGRPKGSKNKKDALRDALTVAAVTAGVTPLEFMLLVMRNSRAALNLRVECAKAAAPYVHRKMPVQLDVSGTVQHSGVMIVPDTGSVDSWEERAREAQQLLRDEVRH